jgi:excinuclease ABC subunit A
MSSQNEIHVVGARQHNLKNVELRIPRDRLVVFTGVSGSGKSSLAFDTIFAEGQRRYVESLSAYARQFLGQLDKPDVDRIEGLSPAISIDQKSTSHNPRSTVGTVTEIYDYLRLLYGRAGIPHCPHCNRVIAPQTVDQIVDQILALPDRTRFQLLSPVVKGKKGTHANLLQSLRQQGFVRVRIDGQVRDLSEEIELAKNKTHTLEVVVDRLVKSPDIAERLADSLATCLRQSGGIAVVELLPREEEREQLLQKVAESAGQYLNSKPTELIFSEQFACPEHGSVMGELSPRLFSFNSPIGACPVCHGLGFEPIFDPERIVPDPKLPLYAAIAPWAERENPYYLALLAGAAKAFGFDLSSRWCDLTPQQQQIILYGADQEVYIAEVESQYRGRGYYRRYEGVIPQLQRHYQETTSEIYRQKLEAYLTYRPCSACGGSRLKPEALAVRIGGYRITDLTEISIRDCLHRLEQLKLTPRQVQIGELVLREIKTRLQFLVDVGLDYLTLGASGHDPLRGRGAADPAGQPDGLRLDGRALRVGRTLHRPAPAGQRAPVADLVSPAGSGQHPDRGGTRRRNHPCRRPHRRYRPWGRHPRGGSGGPGIPGGHHGLRALHHRSLSFGAAADPDPWAAAGRQGGFSQAHQCPQKQPQAH